MTYVMCEVLAWRGIWPSEERRRTGKTLAARPKFEGDESRPAMRPHRGLRARA